MCSVAFGVISLAVDRSSEGSSVITGSLRWRRGKRPREKGADAKKQRNAGECKVSCAGAQMLAVQDMLHFSSHTQSCLHAGASSLQSVTKG